MKKITQVGFLKTALLQLSFCSQTLGSICLATVTIGSSDLISNAADEAEATDDTEQGWFSLLTLSQTMKFCLLAADGVSGSRCCVFYYVIIVFSAEMRHFSFGIQSTLLVSTVHLMDLLIKNDKSLVNAVAWRLVAAVGHSCCSKYFYCTGRSELSTYV